MLEAAIVIVGGNKHSLRFYDLNRLSTVIKFAIDFGFCVVFAELHIYAGEECVGCDSRKLNEKLISAFHLHAFAFVISKRTVGGRHNVTRMH